MLELAVVDRGAELELAVVDLDLSSNRTLFATGGEAGGALARFCRIVIGTSSSA